MENIMKVIKIIGIALLAMFTLTTHAQETQQETQEEPRLTVGTGANGLAGLEFTDGVTIESSQVYDIWLEPNPDGYSFRGDWVGDGRLYLPAGDYQVIFLGVSAWTEWPTLKADVNLTNVEVSSCDSGRDNRTFNYADAWEAIMFCDGYVDWSLTSESFGVVMIVLKKEV